MRWLWLLSVLVVIAVAQEEKIPQDFLSELPLSSSFPSTHPSSLPDSFLSSFPRSPTAQHPPPSSPTTPNTPPTSPSSSFSPPSHKKTQKRQEDSRGPRPQLKNSRVLPLEATVASEKYEYLLSTLEFDQDVYVNHAFVCPGQDEECTPPPCVACDWSGPEPTDCTNPNCCGPAQWPIFPAVNHTADWCDSSLPSYTKLDFNVPSETFTLKSNEIKYFRFFVSEEQACRSILIQPNINFGDGFIYLSKFTAFPNAQSLAGVENNQNFFGGSMFRAGDDYGAGSLMICPNLNPAYLAPGTYAFSVTGSLRAENTEMSVTVFLQEERYPIAPPEDRYSCDDFPVEEFDDKPVYAATPAEVAGHFCLEDGVSLEITPSGSNWYDFVLPIQPGCQEVSLTTFGFTDPAGLINAGFYFYCGQSSIYSFGNNRNAALTLKKKFYLNSLYISACFDELTYLHCSVFPFIALRNSKASFIWSSKSTPIRYKISDVNPGQLSSDLGLSIAGGIHPELNYEALSIWGLDGYAWLTQPSSDPLVFYPPYIEFAYNYTQAPIDAYLAAGFSETQSNIVSIVDLTTKENTIIRDQKTLLDEGFLFIMGITSATGMPVELCNDSDFEKGICGRGDIPVKNSWTDFLSTRTFASLNVVNQPECDVTLYNRQLRLVQEVTSGESDTLAEIAPKAYLSDLYNSGLARSACVKEIETFLETEEDNITKLEKGYCPYEPLSPEWESDPCCQLRLEAIDCCAPEYVTQEDELYTEADSRDVEKSCFNSDCDESFFTDIASSLNVIGNPLIGCASGLGNPDYELSVLIERALASFYRPCLVQAGYGELFEGIECQEDADCEYLDSTCDIVTEKCRPGSSDDMQDRFFECFMDNLPPKVEDYIRFEILNPIDANLDKGSKAFNQAVKEAASIEDCVGRHGVGDLDVGERYISDIALFCKAAGLGVPFSFSTLLPFIVETCPALTCRGERACLFENAKTCGIDTSGWCKAPNRTYIAPSLSSCPLDETICSAEPPVPVDGDDCSGFVCALCPSEDTPCTIVEEITTEEACAAAVACQLPDGSYRYDLSEEQCEVVVGDCTADCNGTSCRSLDDTSGLCTVSGVGVECYGVGGFLAPDGTCWVLGAEDAGSCAQIAFLLSGTPQWYSCGDMDIDTCSNHTAFDLPYQYLKCYVDEFRECETKEECEASGTCSDIEVARSVSPTADWFSVKYGICLTSGIGGSTLDPEPLCFNGFGEYNFAFGCLYRWGTTMEQCWWWGSPASLLAPHWTYWLSPAKTEETCRQKIMGRFGCRLPNDFHKNYYFWDEQACDCMKGTSDYFFDWSPGIWRGGKAHSLTWMERESSPKYEWKDALSFVTMENWVSRAVETSFVYALKSQLVCETNYVTSSLSTLVCDCVGDGEDCFPEDIETEVGISGACADDTSVLKGPSSFTTFSEDSISELCTEASLFLIQRSWFLFPRTSNSVSFQFAERKERGVVLNENKATVGEVMGDGSKILFKNPERVHHFTVCLLIVEDVEEYEDKYPKRDFGIPQNDYSSILPIGLKEVEVRPVELYTYWCAEIEDERIEDDGSVTFFPLLRMEDYEDEDENSISHRTESLLYTLAALYFVDLFLLSLFIFVIVKRCMNGKDIPAVTWLGVIFGCVCVFRIVFCFVYVEDGFSDLSEYVVFEIPTFLLFSGVILVICLFMRLSKKKGFDFKSQDKKLWLLGIFALFLVWSLFIIVTVIYAKVVLEQNEETECPGRVKASNDEIDDDTRTLSIIYQSIVIAFTLILAIIFLRQSIVLFRMTKKSQKAKVFVFRLGSVLVTSFLLRCILFLVLLSIDLTSDIYLFITLLLTEVIMMFLIALEINKSFYQRMMSTVTTGGTHGTLGGSSEKSSESSK